MMNTTRTVIGASILAAGLGWAAVGTAHAASITASTIESSVESSQGLPSGSATYLDLNESFTRDSATLTWDNFDSNNDQWGYPDSSDNAVLVDGDNPDSSSASGSGVDDKQSASPSDINTTVSGLSPNTSFNAYVVAIARLGFDNDTEDFSYDGTTITDFDKLPGAIKIAGDANRASYAVPVGSVISDAGGAFSSTLGDGIDYDPNNGDHRTQIDGLVLSRVPEPASLALMCVGGLLLLPHRRSRHPESRGMAIPRH